MRSDLTATRARDFHGSLDNASLRHTFDQFTGSIVTVDVPGRVRDRRPVWPTGGLGTRLLRRPAQKLARPQGTGRSWNEYATLPMDAGVSSSGSAGVHWALPEPDTGLESSRHERGCVLMEQVAANDSVVSAFEFEVAVDELEVCAICVGECKVH
jgi:hypothetical protein